MEDTVKIGIILAIIALIMFAIGFLFVVVR